MWETLSYTKRTAGFVVVVVVFNYRTSQSI